MSRINNCLKLSVIIIGSAVLVRSSSYLIQGFFTIQNMEVQVLPDAGLEHIRTIDGNIGSAMYPSGFAFDQKNNRLVIADTRRNRVVIYDVNGKRIDEFGTLGTDNGQFDTPRDAAVDEQSGIYIADTRNNRIQKFSASGKFEWATSITSPIVNHPMGLTWDRKHQQLLVASTGNNLIKAFDKDGKLIWASPSPDLTGICSPRDAARGPDGNIWVTDYGNNQIKAYRVNENGDWESNPAMVLGTGLVGHDDNEIAYPYNVAWSPDGDVAYVSDTGNQRIARWKLSADGPVWMPPIGHKELPTPRSGLSRPPAAFYTLRRVETDLEGNIFALDLFAGDVQVFDHAGVPLRIIGRTGNDAVGFGEVYKIAIAQDDSLFLVDRLYNRVQQYSASNELISSVGFRGDDIGQYSWPEAIAIDKHGLVWIADSRNCKIERRSSKLNDGSSVNVFGGRGHGPGLFKHITDIAAASNDEIYILDSVTPSLQILDPKTGEFRVIDMQFSGLRRPKGIAVAENAIFVTDSYKGRVVRLSRSGRFEREYIGLKEPEGITLSADGSVWVADAKMDQIVQLDESLVRATNYGSPGRGAGEFNRPHSLAVHSDKLYVADSLNYRIQVFHVNHREIASRQNRLDETAIYPSSGVIDKHGTIYFSDSGTNRILKVDADRKLDVVSDQGWKHPRAIAWGKGQESLWIANTDRDEVVQISLDGVVQAKLNAEISLNAPYGLQSDNSNLYIADTYNHRIIKVAEQTGQIAWEQKQCYGKNLSRPRDVSISDYGLLVADSDNDRILQLNSLTGECQRSIGSSGIEPGQFRAPISVLADDNGIWVGEAWSHRLQHFALNGNYLSSIRLASRHLNPNCIFKYNSTLYICDQWNNRIDKFEEAENKTLRHEGPLLESGPAADKFNGPFGVAFTDDGSLFVADWFNHRIQKFDRDLSFVTMWGGYGVAVGRFIFPRDVLVHEGKVVVTNSEDNRIDTFSLNGKFIHSIKPKQITFKRPHQVAVAPRGHYWVADTLNDRLVEINSAGDVISIIEKDAKLPKGVAVDSQGYVYVANAAGNLNKYNRSGELVKSVELSLRDPHHIKIKRINGEELVFVCDSGNDRIVIANTSGKVLTSFGTRASGIKILDNPVSLDIDSKGRIAVADFNNNRISFWHLRFR